MIWGVVDRALQERAGTRRLAAYRAFGYGGDLCVFAAVLHRFVCVRRPRYRPVFYALLRQPVESILCRQTLAFERRSKFRKEFEFERAHAHRIVPHRCA